MPLREYVERKEFQAEVVISNVEAAETRVYNWGNRVSIYRSIVGFGYTQRCLRIYKIFKVILE